jgi:hypothetical protein
VHSSTAWAEYDDTTPVTMSRTTMPQATPSLTTRSSISVRVWSVTVPSCTWFIICW